MKNVVFLHNCSSGLAVFFFFLCFFTNLWLASVLKLNMLTLCVGKCQQKKKKMLVVSLGPLYIKSLEIFQYIHRLFMQTVLLYYVILLSITYIAVLWTSIEKQYLKNPFSPSDLIQLMTLENVWQVRHCWKYQCDRWPG